MLGSIKSCSNYFLKVRSLPFNLGFGTVSVLKPCSNTQIRHYAARKGTREKAKKKKIKVEIKKTGFIPHNLREKASVKGEVTSRWVDDSYKPLPIDDVWIGRFYKWKVYEFEEAVNCHRETHHPEVYNQPKAPLQAFIELDMKTAKKTKFVDSFTRISKIPHEFTHGEDRSILVFCKTPELRQQAEMAGAALVGDVDVLKKIEKGDIVLPDFQFILAHPNILPELVGLRGLLKKKFPNPKSGTLGPNIGEMVKNFRTGIQYWALRDEFELDYGWVEATIGTLDMDARHLEDNLQALIEDISSMKPNRPGPFITRVMLKSPPSVERLKLDCEKYLPEEQHNSDSEDEKEKTKATLKIQ